MRQLIIKVEDDGIDDLTALERVEAVVREGKISNGRYGPCYCFMTAFIDRTEVVVTGETKNDLFHVRRVPYEKD